MRAGISTYVFHDERLGYDHLAAVAGQGFEAVELFATRTHFDYRDAAAVAHLAGWLHETRLALHSVHAPIALSCADGVWGPPLSCASADETARREAVAEARAALAVVRTVPFQFLVVHLGVPDELRPAPGTNSWDAAVRSAEEIHALARPLGVRVAFEVQPNALSTPARLVELLEETAELPGAGICFDYGHAFLMGDVVDAVETVSGHLLTTHAHDNDGRRDAHLVPLDGDLDWPSALMATRKVGYEGPLILELAGAGAPGEVLARARQARARLGELWR